MSTETLRRRAWILGDNIAGDTDILPLRFTASRTLDRSELRGNLFASLRPELGQKLRSGDVLLAGENFAHGRLHAQPIMALRESGVIVVARSTPYLAYRRMADAGVRLLITQDSHDSIQDGEEVVLAQDGSFLQVSSGASISLSPMPPFLQRLIEAGGSDALLAESIH